MDYIFSNLDLGTFSNCLFLQAPNRSSNSTRFVQIEVAITGFQQMGWSYVPSLSLHNTLINWYTYMGLYPITMAADIISQQG